VKIGVCTNAHQGVTGQGEPGMDVDKILIELKSEREQIEEAIVSLERLARGRGRRRGRPPSWMTEVTVPKRRGRPPGSKNKALAASASNGSPATTSSKPS
jgi:hypothetical protein